MPRRPSYRLGVQTRTGRRTVRETIPKGIERSASLRVPSLASARTGRTESKDRIRFSRRETSSSSSATLVALIKSERWLAAEWKRTIEWKQFNAREKLHHVLRCVGNIYIYLIERFVHSEEAAFPDLPVSIGVATRQRRREEV